ncbi:MAG: DUF5615 family PIN-like protein [Chitinophagaceae bacterium]|jgi:predicted nuclease of predicted toxin-antitoxin system
MVFIADESTDNNIISSLRENNFSVIAIQEITAGMGDDSILKMCNEAQHILITEDKDFGDLVYHFQMPHHGIILVRCNELSNIEKAKRVVSVIKIHYNDLENSFAVITPSQIRIRKQ